MERKGFFITERGYQPIEAEPLDPQVKRKIEARTAVENAKRKCPSCARVNGPKAQSCLYCGVELPKPQPAAEKPAKAPSAH